MLSICAFGWDGVGLWKKFLLCDISRLFSSLKLAIIRWSIVSLFIEM
jgi:hypothetical protein